MNHDRHLSFSAQSSLLAGSLLAFCLALTACNSSDSSASGAGGSATANAGSGGVAGVPSTPQAGNSAGGVSTSTPAGTGGLVASGGTLAVNGGAGSSSGGAGVTTTTGGTGTGVGGTAPSQGGKAGAASGGAGTSQGGKAGTASGGAGTFQGGKAGAASGGASAASGGKAGASSGGAQTTSAGAAGAAGGPDTSTIIGYPNTDVRKIPPAVVTEIKSRFHIGYAHTSHGSQIVTGMGTLQSYAPFGATYAFRADGTTGLHFDDGMSGGCGSDLSTCNDNDGEPAWLAVTRTYLAAHPTTNVIMWAWCSISGHNIAAYLDGMEKLIGEYGPGGTNARAATTPVTFIFMTGHSEGSNRVPATAAAQIRQHCVDHRRWLIDYYDIESHDMAGRSYDALEITDNLAYSGGNWAQEYITSAGADATLKALTQATSGCAHSDSPSEANLNCVLKSQAFWWALGRIAGWNGK